MSRMGFSDGLCQLAFSPVDQPNFLLAPNAVIIAVQAVNIVSDNVHRSVDISRPIAASASTVHIAGYRNARVIVRIAFLRGAWRTGRDRPQQSYHGAPAHPLNPLRIFVPSP